MICLVGIYYSTIYSGLRVKPSASQLFSAMIPKMNPNLLRFNIKIAFDANMDHF